MRQYRTIAELAKQSEYNRKKKKIATSILSAIAILIVFFTFRYLTFPAVADSYKFVSIELKTIDIEKLDSSLEVEEETKKENKEENGFVILNSDKTKVLAMQSDGEFFADEAMPANYDENKYFWNFGKSKDTIEDTAYTIYMPLDLKNVVYLKSSKDSELSLDDEYDENSKQDEYTFLVETVEDGIYIKDSNNKYLTYDEDSFVLADKDEKNSKLYFGTKIAVKEDEEILLELEEKELEETKGVTESLEEGQDKLEILSEMIPQDMVALASANGTTGEYEGTYKIINNSQNKLLGINTSDTPTIYNYNSTTGLIDQNSTNVSDVQWVFEATSDPTKYRIKHPNKNVYLRTLTTTTTSGFGQWQTTTTTTTLSATTGITQNEETNYEFTIEKDPNSDAVYIKDKNGMYVTYTAATQGRNGKPESFGLSATQTDNAKINLVLVDTSQGGGTTFNGYTPITGTVTPYNSVITLFDYKANDGNNWNENSVSNTNLGINTNHTLKFRSGDVAPDANRYTGEGNGARQGIVSKNLVNGYPVLSGTSVVNNSTESLDYLFNYTENANKKVYKNVKKLLSVDKEGYYYYNSQQNYAYYNESDNSFIVYDQPAVCKDGKGEFFPFNAVTEVSASTNPNSDSLNHYFGLMITNRFVQQNAGYTDSTKQSATTFEFAGDDDVWVYIDDVLVADLGGIRNSVDLTIDFVKGEVVINPVYNGNSSSRVVTNFSNIFAGTPAAQDLATYDGYTTFANETYHTLKFFYLERGGYDSNLKIKFNLTRIPPTNICKMDQTGKSVEGAKFALYAADSNWNYLTNKGGTVVSDSLINKSFTMDSNYNITVNGKTSNALYVDVTAEDGYMSFLNEDGLPYTIAELETKFGNYFVLREVDIPPGYRPLYEEVYLKVENRNTPVA